MENDIAIKVDNVHKTFKIPHEKSSSLKSAALNVFKRKSSTEFPAAKGISFEVKRGEFFGIIGRNGSGKSTMLKMLAGIYLQDKGGIEINGRLSPFLELGVGFNPELTARDNIYLNGAILGLIRKEIDEKFDEIIEFSELEEFVDQRLKNFSSGMQVRLAFSVAIHAHADILFIDEVLAVGDFNFQKKCLEVFERLKREGKTIVFVTHSMGYVRDFCDRVAVIDKGKIIQIGDTEKAIDVYNKLNLGQEERRIGRENTKNKENGSERIGNGKATITKYKIFDNKGKEAVNLETGEKFKIELEIIFNDNVKNPAIGIMFRKNPSENLFGINSHYEKKIIGEKKKGDKLKFIAKSEMPLASGTYYVTFALSDARSATIYEDLDVLNNVIKINVFSEKEYWGFIKSKVDLSVEEV